MTTASKSARVARADRRAALWPHRPIRSTGTGIATPSRSSTTTATRFTKPGGVPSSIAGSGIAKRNAGKRLRPPAHALRGRRRTAPPACPVFRAPSKPGQENAKKHMVLRMSVDPDDAKLFSTMKDAADFTDCELRGFGFHPIIGWRPHSPLQDERRLLPLHRASESAPAIPHPDPA